MQTWITDYDFAKSARNLNRQHLQANIYENIHGLAALLGIVDELKLSDKAKTQAKKLVNKPQCKLWKGYEFELLGYIDKHLTEWAMRGYETKINLINYCILWIKMGLNLERNYVYISQHNLNWITNELIETHRSVLIQKEIKKNMGVARKYHNLIIENHEKQDMYLKKFFKENEKNHHYRRLWPDCPDDLKMKYDWRNEE